jgi:hypothetical protein
MDRDAHWSIVEQQIANTIETLVPNGAGPITSQRLQTALTAVAQCSFDEGRSYALLNLLTVEDLVERLGISARRVRAIALDRHRFGVGHQVGGTNLWLFTPEELPALQPEEKYRRRE